MASVTFSFVSNATGDVVRSVNIKCADNSAAIETGERLAAVVAAATLDEKAGDYYEFDNNCTTIQANDNADFFTIDIDTDS